MSKIDVSARWLVTIREILVIETGLCWPALRWNLIAPNANEQGELVAWSFMKCFGFQAHKSARPVMYYSVEKVLKEIAAYGWSKPPAIEEVFNDMEEVHTGVNPEETTLLEAIEIFQRLQHKWMDLLVRLDLWKIQR